MTKNIVTLLLLLNVISLATASVRPQPVNIPQVNAVYDKQWYSGYLDFQFHTYSAHMHYFYFPSQSQTPEKDPILFWFNGGPGCSSLLGALYEHGPFIFNDAFGFLMKNPQAWNMRANTVYIESPAQVGFSYFFLDPQESYPFWDDQLTADLNLQSLIQFFKTYPEYNGRSTFIAGESYGGIYVPTLAYKVHFYNQNNPQVPINLKGFAVGNGCTDASECEFLSDYPHYLYQLFNDIGILSDQNFANAEKLCSNSSQLSKECLDAMDKIDQTIDGINIYDAFRPCWQNGGNSSQQNSHTFSQLRKMAMRTGYLEDQSLKTFAPPCVDSYGIDKLLNDDKNREAMGIPQYAPGYSMCVPQDSFNYSRSTTGSYYVYQKLLPLNKYKIVIYSGDSDPAVPISGTFTWMKKIKQQLQLSTQIYWKPWMIKTQNGYQNTGSHWGLSNGLSLVRFKGVGHMAPQWNNKGGTKMINYLLFDEPL